MIPIRPFALLLSLLLTSPLHAEAPARLSQAEDLRGLGARANSLGIPILLMVSQYHCGYCELLKNEVLQPMLLSGEYQDRVLMRELLIDPGVTVGNFAGQRESAEAFSQRYQVQVTPTLLFLDGAGREVAEPILGVNTIDYLLFYIEDAIDTATREMNR